MIKQGTPEWHDQRKNRITGTRLPRAVKECAWAKGDQWEALGRDIYREAHNLSQDPFDQRAMFAITYGKDHEPIALQQLKENPQVEPKRPPYPDRVRK